MTIIRSFVLCLLAGAVLSACSSNSGNQPANGDSNEASAAGVRVLSEARVIPGNPAPERRRLIADLLYEGLQALDDDRLLTPVDDSAHARFRRVLAYEPNNSLALEGLEAIVLRYVELADDATRQGLFAQAAELLDRARFVDESHAAIAAAEQRLREEQESGDLFFDLSASQIAARSESVQGRLADIARQAREHEAFFLITAPSDEQARWIYSVMRAAVAGYRLRGNIELASRYSIRLRLPEETDG